MKYITLFILALALTGCNENESANKTLNQYPVQNGWALTDDLTRSSSFTTRVLIDPHGQKFLVISGTGIIPYKEPEATKVEK